MVDSTICPAYFNSNPYCHCKCPSWRGSIEVPLFGPLRAVCFKINRDVSNGAPCVPALQRDRDAAREALDKIRVGSSNDFERGARSYAEWRARRLHGAIKHAMNMVDKFLEGATDDK